MKFYSKNRLVYKKIKESILNGEYKPGDRLKIEKLASIFGVSETPIREAIRVLQGEDLLKVDASKEVSVTKMNLQELKDMLMVRFELEKIATRIATENILPEDIKELDNQLNKEKNCIDLKKYKEYWKLNRKYHSVIYKKAKNNFLYKIIFELWDKTERARSVFLLVPKSIQESFTEHIEIRTALTAKDSELAVNLLKKHKERSYNELINIFKKSGELINQNIENV